MKVNRLSKVLAAGLVCLIVVGLNVFMFKAIPVFTGGNDNYIMGGTVFTEDEEAFASAASQYIMPDDNYIERFLRPAAENPLEKKFSQNGGEDNNKMNFKMPSEAARAYFEILSDASNLGSKKGGCGSIGLGSNPYPAAYNLLSDSFKKALSYDKFHKSFDGIGHINLMKLVEMPAVKIDNTICARVFTEIEAIEGSDTQGKTYFAYYYGYVTLEQDRETGWKINGIQLKPEDFLCHAYHGWWHDAGTVVDVLYNKKCGVIDKILGVEEDGSFRNVLAKGKDGRQYRFMFIRITNGADIELRQYVMEDGKWKDTYIDTGRK